MTAKQIPINQKGILAIMLDIRIYRPIISIVYIIISYLFFFLAVSAIESIPKLINHTGTLDIKLDNIM